MNFSYNGQVYSIATKKPNIVILPGNKLFFYGGQYDSMPAQFIDGNILLSFLKLITFQGGINVAKLV
jgi:hypothetical protein